MIAIQICCRFPLKGLLFMILVEKKLNLSFYLLSRPHLTPETSMSKLIWVNPPVGHLSIGLHFWHPCHLLASVLTLSRVQNRQVSYSSFMSSATVLFSHKAEKTENDIYWCEMLCFMVNCFKCRCWFNHLKDVGIRRKYK